VVRGAGGVVQDARGVGSYARGPLKVRDGGHQSCKSEVVIGVMLVLKHFDELGSRSKNKCDPNFFLIKRVYIVTGYE